MNSFQKYISYLSRITVERCSTDYNEKLVVAIQDGKYVLNAKNANYSFASLHRVFRQALKKIKITESDITSVLVLGCGAGSIPKIVYKELGLNPQMDAVEIDQKVIDLGNKYFELSSYENLNVIVDDAVNFIKKSDKKYDLILVDIFKGINVPNEILEQHFLEHLKSRLNPNGEVLLNYVAYNYDTKEKVKDIQKQFADTFSLNDTFRFEDINRIFYGKK